ncbi:MAG: PEGA domain-containing protein [Myxococcales bacterium]|nr:PEGA domain-containing protein [Myxococcales bacterium]
MRAYLSLLAALGVAAPASAAENERVVIAVFPIQDTAEVLDAKTEQGLTDYLGAKLAESSRFVVVPRTDIEAALKAQKAESYEACYDQSCQIEIGKELAAQKVVHTQILKVGDSCAIASTIYDLRMAATDAAASERSACTENALVESLEKVARTLTRAVPDVGPLNPVPAFTLRVTAEPTDADVLVDGRRQGSGAGVSVPLSAGEPHELTVESDGYVTHVEQVTLSRDERRSVQLHLTSDARTGRTEWFGLSLAGGVMANGGWNTGVWLRAINLGFGDLRWTVLEGYVGVVGSKTSYVGELAVDECAKDQIAADGYCRRNRTGLAGYLGTRLGYGITLDKAGSHRVEAGLGAGLYAINDTDDAIVTLGFAPGLQYLHMSDGKFVWGVGVRALVPATKKSCVFGNTGGSYSELTGYVRCANAQPYMFQLEIPLGWYY